MRIPKLVVNMGRLSNRGSRRWITTIQCLEPRLLLVGDLVSHWVADDLGPIVDQLQIIPSWTDRVAGIQATAKGEPRLVKGILDGRDAIWLDPIDGADYFRLTADASPISGAEDFSVVALFATTSTFENTDTHFWFENNGLVDANQFGFQPDWGLTFGGDGQVGFGVGPINFADGSTTVFSESKGLNDGLAHVAIATRSSDLLTLYADGIAQSAQVDSGPRGNLDVSFGALQDGRRPFNGYLAEIRFYDGALTSEEAQKLSGELTRQYANSSPNAVDDQYETTEDTPLRVPPAEGVLQNDNDEENDSVSAEIVAAPGHGTLELNPDGSFQYLPDADYFGVDSFTYVAKDDRSSDPATVTVDVMPTYDPGVAIADHFLVDAGAVRSVPAASGLLANDSNIDQLPLKVELVRAVEDGSLAFADDGSFIYESGAFAGTTSFDYRLDDSVSKSNIATVTLLVDHVPVAVNDQYGGVEDMPLVVPVKDGLLANDLDLDGDKLQVRLSDTPTRGTVDVTVDGGFRYVPFPEYAGTDAFTYQVSDGDQTSPVATVQINVVAKNDPPNAKRESYFVTKNRTLSISREQSVLANDDDTDTNALTAELVQTPQHGTISLRTDGSFTFVPEREFIGTDTFAYRARDSENSSAATFVQLRVAEHPVIVSEFQANNTGVIHDSDGDESDWIEIHNRSQQAVDLSGWSLQDGQANAAPWKFPEGTSISGQEYVVVFASGKNRSGPAELHTDFKLNANGDKLVLRDRSGEQVTVFGDGQEYSTLPWDSSFGLVDETERTTFVDRGSNTAVLIPTLADQNQYGTSWQGGSETTFQAKGGTTDWIAGSMPLGFGSVFGGNLKAYREAIQSEPSLISVYTFENTDESSVPDRIDTHDGQLVGDANTNEVGIGMGADRALALATQGEYGYVDLGRVQEFEFSDGTGTVELWIRPDWRRGSLDANPSFFSIRDRSRSTYSFHLRQDFSAIDVFRSGTKCCDAFNFPFNGHSPSQWHHIVVAIGDGEVTVYVDGQSVGTKGFEIGPVGFNAKIGHTLQRREYWRGAVDEVSVFADTLGPEAVSSHFEALGGIPSTNTTLGTDLEIELHSQDTSAWLRVPFHVDSPDEYETLDLDILFNDGFAAYINGHFVGSANAPTNLNHDSRAIRPTTGAASTSIDVTGQLQLENILLAGTNVLSIHAISASIDDGNLFVQPTLVGSKTTKIDQRRLFAVGTPGQPNADGLSGFVADTTFAVGRGFFNAEFEEIITTTTPGATLAYTLDGSAPTLRNGTQVQAADEQSRPEARIVIDQTTVLRAAAFRDGFLPANVNTQTYLFAEDIGRQPEMDPEVVFDPVYEGLVSAGLQSLPVLSFVMGEDDLFGAQGIYTNPHERGREWERPLSVEFFTPEDNQQFQVDAGLRIHGAEARNHQKKPLRLHFREDYGSGRLQFPLFPDSPVTTFDNLVLRGGGHEAWTSPHGSGNAAQALSATYIRDQFLRETELAMGQLSGHGRHVNLYLNGKYWGVYIVQERPDANFQADHLGGDPDDWDAFNTQAAVVDGNADAWNTMMAMANAGLTTGEAYQKFRAYVNIDSVIDDTILRVWAGDIDWLRSENEIAETGNRNKNWHASRNRNGGQFRFFLWDGELSMGKGHRSSRNLGFNLTDVDIDNSPGRVYAKLKENAEFRVRYGDRLNRHFFNNGAMTPHFNQARWNALASQIEDAVVAESARWGDANRRAPYTRDVEWRDEVQWMADTYMTKRNAIVLQQFQDIGLYPSVDAPRFSQHGGQFDTPYPLRLSADIGEIYFTNDGSDPRLPGGELSNAAQKFTDVTMLNTKTTIKARVLHGDQWSALTEAQFVPTSITPSFDNLRVSEVHFNPGNARIDLGEADTDNDDFEFIEIANFGSNPINLMGLQFVPSQAHGVANGIRFVFGEQVLQPGQAVVVVKNQDAFFSRYPNGVVVAKGTDGEDGNSGEYGGRLSNGGEELTLADPTGNVLQQLSYDDGWYRSTDGQGYSLETISPAAATLDNWKQVVGWQPSAVVGGTPGFIYMSGDLDGNLIVDCADIESLFNGIHRDTNDDLFDLNQDGRIDTKDVDYLLANVLGTRRGDTNLDGIIDVSDFESLAAHFGQASESWHEGDFDGDGTVSFRDFNLLATNFGFGSGDFPPKQ